MGIIGFLGVRPGRRGCPPDQAGQADSPPDRAAPHHSASNSGSVNARHTLSPEALNSRSMNYSTFTLICVKECGAKAYRNDLPPARTDDVTGR